MTSAIQGTLPISGNMGCAVGVWTFVRSKLPALNKTESHELCHYAGILPVDKPYTLEKPEQYRSMAIKTLTFGCRLNAYETEVMAKKAREAGLDDLHQDAILINTCAVTGEAVRQAKQAIRRARRENPAAKIIVSGCAAQSEPQTFAAMEEIDLILGNEEKLASQSYRALPEFGINQFEKVRVNDIMEVKETASHMVQSVEGYTRAFVQVQNGCDHRCTFCIIPYGRGNSRSVPAGEVVEQIKQLVGNGYQEVVLTGVDTTSWGGDLPGKPKLGNLVQSVLRQVPALKHLRLSSIDSIEVDESLMEAIASEQRFLPHLHLSLQHGDNLILKRMKRRHSREDSVRFCEVVKKLRPDMVFGADLMAGFPTETEAMFENLISVIDDCDISIVHSFPFSPRPGTPAANMPQLDRSIIKERAKLLRQKGDRVFSAFLDRCIGKEFELLMEKNHLGRTRQFTPVKVEASTKLEPGQFAKVKIEGHDGKKLLGRLIDNQNYLGSRAA